ncbi:hypothetical protein GCM10010168_92410 [Actinoplanes ianthinogenes]|uniref:Uncharacterized protein n=1 Tax=Actinoplanes ianthinogenes TaxID=122358 RepID=A0ABM7LJY6_9ACTN|nr:hypothetical protein [Actinoplanes ianthinogenes]BCJ39580.1 hypothetical protein Aiant_02370 [Actinoplanes ianthinogenes]GGR58988.1 hypothetical protein GCM10010168_92410 [Actinoplanes ianthinogenes]
MEIALDPPHGAGPVRLGMTADEARAALETLGPLAPGALGELAITLPSGLYVSVGFGVSGPTAHRVNAIELHRPDQDTDTVRFRDVDVFTRPAERVLDGLRRLTRVDEDEDTGGFIAPDLLLAFSLDDGYFASVLLARPGYYDTPAQAAARDHPGY